MRQIPEQPSPGRALLSSHDSPSSTIPLPHTGPASTGPRHASPHGGAASVLLEYEASGSVLMKLLALPAAPEAPGTTVPPSSFASGATSSAPPPPHAATTASAQVASARRTLRFMSPSGRKG